MLQKKTGRQGEVKGCEGAKHAKGAGLTHFANRSRVMREMVAVPASSARTPLILNTQFMKRPRSAECGLSRFSFVFVAQRLRTCEER